MFLRRIEARQTKVDAARLTGYFSADYFMAQDRFLAACDRLGFERRSLLVDAPSPTAAPLAIDVAICGARQPTSAIVVSSGIHGVEGFFGSAVQLAFLEKLSPDWRPPEGAAIVLLHALNPFGFAWQRRFNEENIDLNRNFLLPEQTYSGAPPLSDLFRQALQAAPGAFGFQNARMAKLAWRYGVRSFWETLPVGQYDHPDWLFFGGRAPSQSSLLLDPLLPSLLGQCQEVVHLDLHTGLGRWANWELLLSEQEPLENVAWWSEHFGASRVKASASAPGSYAIRGGFGDWLRARFPQCRYRFATAEFGTYAPLRVIQALTNELHWHGQLGHTDPQHWARLQLTEAFAPRDARWRATSLAAGLSLLERAVHALWPLAGTAKG